MRVTVGQSHAASATHTAVAQRASPAERERVPATGIIVVWRSALAVFVSHAPAILLLTCVCIAGPAILGLCINAALGLDTFVHMGGPLSTWESIITLRLRGSDSSILVISLVLQAGFGAVGLAFARGVIARLALSGGDMRDALNLSRAFREAMTRLPSLLVGSLIYGACVTAGTVGINAALRDTDFDLRLVGRRDVTTPAQALALRALDAFVPGPGSPFAEFVPLLRHASFAETSRFASTAAARSSGDNRHWAYIYDQAQGPSANGSTSTGRSSTPVFAISLASLGVLLLAEALLRFTSIMAMSVCGRTRLDAITPVLRSVEFGIRHFGAITTHVWLLRLAFVVSYSIFFMLPVVLSDDVVPPIVRSMTRSVMGSWSVVLTLVCHALVTALVVAFSTVYDAQLAVQLDPRMAGHS